MNGLTVIPNMMADFQKECNRKLTDRSRAVNRNIGNRDSLLSGKFIVNDIISRRKYSNQFDISAAGNCVPRNRGLVRYNDFRITNALGDDWSMELRPPRNWALRPYVLPKISAAVKAPTLPNLFNFFARQVERIIQMATTTTIFGISTMPFAKALPVEPVNAPPPISEARKVATRTDRPIWRSATR